MGCVFAGYCCGYVLVEPPVHLGAHFLLCVCVCGGGGGGVGGVNTCSQTGWCKVHHNYHYMFVLFLAVGGLAATF